jgi:hypothetical protein
MSTASIIIISLVIAAIVAAVIIGLILFLKKKSNTVPMAVHNIVGDVGSSVA